MPSPNNGLQQEMIQAMARSGQASNQSPERSQFFVPQTEQVNLDVTGDLSDLERIMRSLGEESATISSGRRSPESLKQILEQRIGRENLGQYEPAQEAIREILLRGSSPEDITYGSGNWYPQAEERIRQVDPENAQEILQRIGNVRKDFGGYQSPHMQGKKVDIPKSSFIQRHGAEAGEERFQQLQNLLQQEGYKTLYEPEAGQQGVLDIKLKDIPQR